METLKEEKIQGKYGILSRLTGNKFEVIGGHTGTGKSYYIMRLIAKLAANGKTTRVFLNEDQPNSYLRRLHEVSNYTEELRGRISICTLCNRGEDPEGLAELITSSSLEYDVVIVDSVLYGAIGEIEKLMGNIESKVIFVTQLNRHRLPLQDIKQKREIVANITVSTPTPDEGITDEELADYKSRIEDYMKDEIDGEARVEVDVYIKNK